MIKTKSAAQLSLSFEELDALMLLAAAPINISKLQDIPYGRAVTVISSDKIVARVRPRGFLLNSNLVSDVLNRGDCFVANMTTGDLTIVRADTDVTY